MIGINIDLPRKVCRRAIEFLVKEISPAANCLPQRNAWRGNIRPLEKIEVVSAAIKIQSNCSTNHSTWDSKPTFPDGKCIQWMCEIPTCGDPRGGRWSENVPESCTDDSTDQQIGQ